tara:strand:+ start:652 stop:828 length:177 start_codon:yes stop_codon:yes gene_type:complete
MTDNFVSVFFIIAVIVIILYFVFKGKESAKDVFWVILVIFAALFILSLIIMGVIGVFR